MNASALPLPIRQPGPASEEPIHLIQARGRSFHLTLPAGMNLLDAVRAGFAEHGFTSGVVELRDVPLAPLAYVIPALAVETDHAAFYSETYRPPGITRIDTGALTFGTRDKKPFFHAHALWTLNDGLRHGGHILPDETMIATTSTVQALGLAGAAFATSDCPETHFTVFGPIVHRRSSTLETHAHVFVVRICPNQDLHAALELICAMHGMSHVRIRGGVGSLVGARFDDGREVERFATEVFISEGLIAPGPSGAIEASIEVGLVDYTGEIAEGRLKRGANRVLMTFELVLEAA